MSSKFEYTIIVQRYTARFPVLSYVGTQVNFWILANMLLVTVMDFQSQIFSQIFKISIGNGYGSMVLVAILLGILHGVSLGLAGYYFDRKFLRKLSLGRVILFKALGSLAFLTLLTLLLRFFLFDFLIFSTLNQTPVTLSWEMWKYLFYLMLIYYSFMTFVISFINQVNKKYGPGVLLPLLLGRYRDPKEEERIFMFMDLKSSTTTAEKLGHLKYSAFIRDCFADINEMLFPFCAQVYQYVGDEIVLMWPSSEGLNNHNCVQFYFACKKQFRHRAEYYKTNYDLIPVFKAGLHMGNVMAVEIGEIKKDIAYHGDTLNIAARIQSVCNEYRRDFLVSEYLLRTIGVNIHMKTEALGMVMLRGKTEPIAIASVAWMDGE